LFILSPKYKFLYTWNYTCFGQNGKAKFSANQESVRDPALREPKREFSILICQPAKLRYNQHVNRKIIEYRLSGKENVWLKVMVKRKTSKRRLKKHSKRNGLQKEPKERACNFARRVNDPPLCYAT